jgi:PAS domain S-box-containing protein
MVSGPSDQGDRQFLEALLNERQRWELVLQGTNDGIWDWDLRTNKVFYSQQWKAMLGYAEGEITGELREWKTRVHPDDLDRVYEAIPAHCDRKTPVFRAEYRIRCKDGQYKWVLNRGKALWDQAGVAIRLAAVQTDITDWKQTEQDLSQQRDFTTTILETMTALVVVLNRQGKIVRFNRACEQLSGYSEQEALGQYLWDFLLLPEEQGVVKAIFERLIQGQTQSHFENHWVSKTGKQSLIAWSNTVLFQPTGAVEYVIGTGTDITDHRQNQARLELQHRQSQLLAEMTQKIRQSLDLNHILQTVTTEVQHLLGCDRVFILKVQDDGTGLPAAEALIDPQFSLANLPPVCFDADYLRYYQHHPISVIHDLAETDQSLSVRPRLERMAARSELGANILKQNQFWGVLIAQRCGQPRKWNRLEQHLIQQLADQLGIAIDQVTLFDHLEVLVEQRTQELTRINTQLQQEMAERQQITEALQESEQQLAGILKIAGEAIISIDQAQIIQLFNQQAERIFGYRAQEVIGKPLDILVPDVFQKIHRQHVRSFAESPEISRRMAERVGSQVYGKRKDGTEFPAEASISKLKTKEGYLFTVMLKDISLRYQSEQALHRSEAQLRLITNALPVLISYIDADQRYRFNNYAYESWLGIPYQQLENLHIKDLLGEQTYQVLQPYLEKALTGKSVTFEMEFPHQDGNRHWVSVSYIPDIEANRVKGCFGLVSDISDRKAAERVKDDFCICGEP